METARATAVRQRIDNSVPLVLYTTRPATVKTYNYLKTQYEKSAPVLRDPYQKDPVQWTETHSKRLQVGHTVVRDDPSQMVYRYRYSEDSGKKLKPAKPQRRNPIGPGVSKIIIQREQAQNGKLENPNFLRSAVLSALADALAEQDALKQYRADIDAKLGESHSPEREASP